MPKPVNPATLDPVRWIVEHVHSHEGSPAERVQIGYHTDYPNALACAINTASRYEGTLYADLGGWPFTFVRSYAPERGPTPEGRTESPSGR